MSRTKGRVTLPSEANFYKETQEMLERWGADAIRDSDGTKLTEDIQQLNAKIYTTYFVSRGHNEHASKHMEECQQLYLMSNYNLALGEELEIDFMEGYFKEQLSPDYVHDPKKWWEVINRTTKQVVDPALWSVDQKTNKVIIQKATSFHEYTVSFLVYMIWDPTQMYNHITNHWGDTPHDIPFDVRQEASSKYVVEYLKEWIKNNPNTDVVRFTTFFYHFTLVSNHLGKEKFVDWFGYGASVSPAALEAFEQEKGYALRAEDFVDEGCYNSSFRVPTKRYLDYVDFISSFVAKKAKELVDIVHAEGKEAVMFLGDNWIGTEPYGPYFEEIGLDAVAGSVGGGTTLRMISEIPHVKYTEGRFLPYFFPDTFCEGNDPCIEAVDNWITARRAMMRKPLDRIGYGGYLSLAYQFPKFVDYIESVTDEFRLLYDNINGVKPYSGLKVAIINSWGKLRSWQTHMVAHALWYKQIYSYLGVLESLSGASVEVSFLSFAEVKEHGIPKDIEVIINAGDEGTAFSGGVEWSDEKLVQMLRKWIYNGGGYVGIGEPSAYPKGGHYFQLAEAMGVDKELGFTLSTDKYFNSALASHYITADRTEAFDFGESMKNVYALNSSTEIIEYSNGEIHLSANTYGQGRAVYIAGLPYSKANTRLLMRSMFYAASKEKNLYLWYADNYNCEVHAYPAAGKYAIVNNSNEPQKTLIYDASGRTKNVELAPCEIKWEAMSSNEK
ncbi:MAG: 1,3-beta-galactosyl-N-acetylhexosamine phosphorylase [Mobilitalea sp.]